MPPADLAEPILARCPGILGPIKNYIIRVKKQTDVWEERDVQKKCSVSRNIREPLLHMNFSWLCMEWWGRRSLCLWGCPWGNFKTRDGIKVLLFFTLARMSDDLLSKKYFKQLCFCYWYKLARKARRSNMMVIFAAFYFQEEFVGQVNLCYTPSI